MRTENDHITEQTYLQIAFCAERTIESKHMSSCPGYMLLVLLLELPKTLPHSTTSSSAPSGTSANAVLSALSSLSVLLPANVPDVLVVRARFFARHSAIWSLTGAS